MEKKGREVRGGQTGRRQRDKGRETERDEGERADGRGQRDRGRERWGRKGRGRGQRD